LSSSHPSSLGEYHPLSVSFSWVLGPVAPLPVGLTIPQQQICFMAKSSNKLEEEKWLSMYNLSPHPSVFLVSSVTMAWVAVKCGATRCLFFPKYTFKSYMYPVEWQSLYIFMPKHLCFYGMYCLKITLSLYKIITLSMATFSERL
jgi:hypothetical protein